VHETKVDSNTYSWAGFTLRAGFYVSFALMVAGLVWWLAAGMPGGVEAPSGVVPFDHTFTELGAGNPLALLDLGVLVLLATPALTIAAVTLAYATARNWRYAALSLLIFAVLLLSVALSLKWIVL
jgi:uncharacterized membrane protein